MSENDDEKEYNLEGAIGEININGARIIIFRGFANAEKLVNVSKAISEYQRKEDSSHIDGIVDFLKEIPPAVRFLPEVILIPNKMPKINLKYAPRYKNKTYRLTLKTAWLNRVDGNHRLQALDKILKSNDKDISGILKESQFSFSIILWDAVKKDNQYAMRNDLAYGTDVSITSIDNEAFLFYFLNSKAKPLTHEENYRKLVSTPKEGQEGWNDNDIAIANPILPKLRNFNKSYEESKASLNLEKYFKNPLRQMSDVLKEDYTRKDDCKFGKECCYQELLSAIDFKMYFSMLSENYDFMEAFQKQFPNYYPQLMLHLLIDYSMEERIKKQVRIIENYFKNRPKLNHSVFKDSYTLWKFIKNEILERKIYKIFVAVERLEDSRLDALRNKYTNVINEAQTKLQESMNVFCELIPIMESQSEASKIDQAILKNINDCDIFICDLALKKDKQEANKNIKYHNPNVMFELGLAQGKEKKIIINVPEYIGNFPFDIYTNYHYKYNPEVISFDEVKESIIKIIESLNKTS